MAVLGPLLSFVSQRYIDSVAMCPVSEFSQWTSIAR